MVVLGHPGDHAVVQIVARVVRIGRAGRGYFDLDYPCEPSSIRLMEASISYTMHLPLARPSTPPVNSRRVLYPICHLVSGSDAVRNADACSVSSRKGAQMSICSIFGELALVPQRGSSGIST